tara:strand:- start:944 stop:1942 length:999 start_codon:yes stop_codon:yes gene_type:complete
MKYLITGGAGFIGSNFIKYLFSKYEDVEVVNLDKLTYCGNLENLKDVEGKENYKFVKGDVCDAELVNDLMKGVDVVVHFAAETHVDKSIMDPSAFIKTDVIGTYVLLEAARKNNIKKFIQISTDEVYGSIEEGSFKETDELKPRNPYSASKAGADRLAYSFYCTYNVPVIITRSSNNFGPNQYPEKLIPLFVTNLIEGNKVPVYGDGMNVRDWIYVLDNCEGIDFVINNGKIGDVYNIGGDNEKTNIEITKLLLNLLGKDENSIEHVKDRLGHDKRYSLDSSKVSSLGWKPQFDFGNALKETVDWYKNNEEWWKKIKSGEFLEYYKKQYGNK